MLQRSKRWFFSMRAPKLPEDKNALMSYFIKPCKTIERALMIVERDAELFLWIKGYVQFKLSRNVIANKKYDPRLFWEFCTLSIEIVYKRLAESPHLEEGPWIIGDFGLSDEEPKKSLLIKFIEKDISKEKLLRKYPKELAQLEPLLPYVMDLKAEKVFDSRKLCNKTVICYWGVTGVGKTQKVYDRHPNTNIFVVWDCKFPFFLYAQEEVVIFDNYNGWIGLQFLLQLLHRYPNRFFENDKIIYWCPKVIYFTSIEEPTTWYPNTEQLIERLNSVIHVDFSRKIDLPNEGLRTQDETTTSTSDSTDSLVNELEKKDNTQDRTIFDPSWFLESPPINTTFQDYFFYFLVWLKGQNLVMQLPVIEDVFSVIGSYLKNGLVRFVVEEVHANIKKEDLKDAENESFKFVSVVLGSQLSRQI